MSDGIIYKSIKVHIPTKSNAVFVGDKKIMPKTFIETTSNVQTRFYKMLYAKAMINSKSSFDLVGTISNIEPTQFFSNLVYHASLLRLNDAGFSMTDNVFRVLLLNKYYIPNVKHTFADIINSGTEITSNSTYTSGGKVVDNVRFNKSRVSIDADFVKWDHLIAKDVRYAMVYINKKENCVNNIRKEHGNTPFALFDFGKVRQFNNDTLDLLFGVYSGDDNIMVKFSQPEIKIPLSVTC